MSATTILKFARTLTTVLVVTIAGAVVLITLAIPRLTGGAALTVLSGSMEPTVPVGSLALIRPVEPETVRVGDVITVQPSPGQAVYITHRVVEIQDDTGSVSFITKGDANKGNDADPVPPGAVRGKLWLHIPHMGTARDLVGSPTGLAAIGGLIALVQVAPAVGRRLRRARSGGPEVRGKEIDPVSGIHVADNARAAPAAVGMLPAASAVQVVRREVMVLTVSAPLAERDEVTRLIEIVGGSIIDVNHVELTASVCAEPHLLDDLEVLLSAWTSTTVRSGAVGVAKLDPTVSRPDVVGGIVPFRLPVELQNRQSAAENDLTPTIWEVIRRLRQDLADGVGRTKAMRNGS